jgi:hypothetical protein
MYWQEQRNLHAGSDPRQPVEQVIEILPAAAGEPAGHPAVDRDM